MIRGAVTAARLHLRAQAVPTPRLQLASSCISGQPIARDRHWQPKTSVFPSRSVAMAANPAKKSRTALNETEGGAFVRKGSVYRDWIEEGGKFPPEGQLKFKIMFRLHERLPHDASKGISVLDAAAVLCSRTVHPVHQLRLPRKSPVRQP